MLRLAVAQIKATRRSKESRRLVWVDIGGGTGKSHFEYNHP